VNLASCPWRKGYLMRKPQAYPGSSALLDFSTPKTFIFYLDPGMMYGSGYNYSFGPGMKGYGERSGGPTYGQGAARGLAEDFLAGYLPGARVLES